MPCTLQRICVTQNTGTDTASFTLYEYIVIPGRSYTEQSGSACDNSRLLSDTTSVFISADDDDVISLPHFKCRSYISAGWDLEPQQMMVIQSRNETHEYLKCFVRGLSHSNAIAALHGRNLWQCHQTSSEYYRDGIYVNMDGKIIITGTWGCTPSTYVIRFTSHSHYYLHYN